VKNYSTDVDPFIWKWKNAGVTSEKPEAAQSPVKKEGERFLLSLFYGRKQKNDCHHKTTMIR